MHEVRTTCPYCGVGCGVLATTDGKQITAVRGDPDHPGQLRPPVQRAAPCI